MKREDQILEGVRLEFQAQMIEVLIILADGKDIGCKQLQDIREELKKRHKELERMIKEGPPVEDVEDEELIQ